MPRIAAFWTGLLAFLLLQAGGLARGPAAHSQPCHGMAMTMSAHSDQGRAAGGLSPLDVPDDAYLATIPRGVSGPAPAPDPHMPCCHVAAGFSLALIAPPVMDAARMSRRLRPQRPLSAPAVTDHAQNPAIPPPREFS